MNIGIFDSGLGGLSSFQDFMTVLPNYSYVYLGDTARVPYGGRPRQEVIQFTLEAVQWLFQQHCGLIILGCNTATAAALKIIQDHYLPTAYPDRKVLGIIQPTLEAIQATQKQRIGVLATENTVSSRIFSSKLKSAYPEGVVIEEACPQCVSALEAGEDPQAVFAAYLKPHLRVLQKKKVEVVVLGCTHFELLKRYVRDYVGSQVPIIAEGEILADKLKAYLQHHPEIDVRMHAQPSQAFYFTSVTTTTKSWVHRLFPQLSTAPILPTTIPPLPQTVPWRSWLTHDSFSF